MQPTPGGSPGCRGGEGGGSPSSGYAGIMFFCVMVFVWGRLFLSCGGSFDCRFARMLLNGGPSATATFADEGKNKLLKWVAHKSHRQTWSRSVTAEWYRMCDLCHIQKKRE